MGALDAISFEARAILLEALMNVAWADRTLVEEERKAAQAAAMGLGLVLPGDRDLTSPDRKPIPPEQLDVSKLNQRDREIVLLCAEWMALADDVLDPSETKVLERLQARFGVDDARRAWLAREAKTLHDKQTPSGSWWRAFDKLVVEAAKHLSEQEDER